MGDDRHDPSRLRGGLTWRLTAASVPALWRLARLEFDPVRQQRVLLYPEGVVLLNDTGGAILDLCDGRRSVAEIAGVLKERYQCDVTADVIEYLSRLVEESWSVSSNHPTTLLAELTHRCPLHCPYCSNPLEMSRASAELTTEDWKRVFTEARELGVLQLGLSGGEPLVRPDVEELAAHARTLGLYTTLVTSGVGLTERRAAQLREAGLEHIQISIQDSDHGRRRSDRRHERRSAEAGGRGHRARARLRVFDQRRAAPRQHRSRGRDHRAGGVARRRPPRAGEHAVLRLGAREPAGADADAASGGCRQRRRRRGDRADIAGACRSSTCCPITTSRIRSRATAGGADTIWS